MIQLHLRGTESPVRVAAMSERHVETALVGSFDENTTKLLRERHLTAWPTTRFERSLCLPVSSMVRRAMMLWITDTLDEWRERYIDGIIDLWCDAIARDHHAVPRLPGRPPRLFDWMSRNHQTPVEVLHLATDRLLLALTIFRAGDVVTGRIDGTTVYFALREHERVAAARRPAPIPPHDIPLAAGRLMERHGGTATMPAPGERSHGPTGKPRAEPDAFDDDWRAPAQPADAEPETPTRPPRWRYRKPA